MQVSDWILTADGAGVMRVLGDSSAKQLKNRIAFIEKTARVRIRPWGYGPSDNNQDWLNWCEGYRGSGIYDIQSRYWCDNMLKVLGYELPKITDEDIQYGTFFWRENFPTGMTQVWNNGLMVFESRTLLETEQYCERTYGLTYQQRVDLRQDFHADYHKRDLEREAYR